MTVSMPREYRGMPNFFRAENSTPGFGVHSESRTTRSVHSQSLTINERKRQMNLGYITHRTFQLTSLAAIIVLCAAAIVIPIPAPVAAQEQKAADSASADQTLIRITLEHYFRGHATGDGSHMRRAFLPTAHIEGVRDGKFTSWTLDEYVKLFNGTPAADEAKRMRTIDAIDVNGNAAMAKATLDYPIFHATDYFVLLKIDGQWKITNKVYSIQRR